MVVVQQPEVVDIDEGDAERQTGRSGALDLIGQVTDECPVVQGARQRVAPDRLDELGRLSGEPSLRRAEDQKEKRGRDESGAERHEDHVAADLAQSLKDGVGIPPDADDGANLAAAGDRQVLADQPIRTDDSRTGVSLGDRDDRGLGGPADGEGKGFVSRPDPAGGRSAGGDDPTVGSPDLDPKDLPWCGQRSELLGENGELSRRWAGVRVAEISTIEMRVDECSDRRSVAAHDVIQRRCGEVRGNHRRLRRRRDPDEGEKGTVYQEQENGPADSRLGNSHWRSRWESTTSSL